METEPTMPRNAPRQTLRANAPAATAEECYRINYSVPFLDHIIVHLNSAFVPTKSKFCNLISSVVPRCMNDAFKDSPSVWKKSVLKFANHYKDDMPLFCNINTEFDIWRQSTEQFEQSAVRPIAEKIVRYFGGNSSYGYNISCHISTANNLGYNSNYNLSVWKVHLMIKTNKNVHEKHYDWRTTEWSFSIKHTSWHITSRFVRKNERRMSLINVSDTDLPEKQKVSELDIVLDLWLSSKEFDTSCGPGGGGEHLNVTWWGGAHFLRISTTRLGKKIAFRYPVSELLDYKKFQNWKSHITLSFQV